MLNRHCKILLLFIFFIKHTYNKSSSTIYTEGEIFMQEQNIKLFQEAINEQYEAIKYYGDMKKQTKDSNNMVVIDQIQKR